MELITTLRHSRLRKEFGVDSPLLVTHAVRGIPVCAVKDARKFGAPVPRHGASSARLAQRAIRSSVSLRRPNSCGGSDFTLIPDLGDLDFLVEVAGLGSYKDVPAQSERSIVAYSRLEGLSKAKQSRWSPTRSLRPFPNYADWLNSKKTGLD